MSKAENLQESFLDSLRESQQPVSVFLVNGIKLQGKIHWFDQFVIILENHNKQMIYKHAVSTVVPSQEVNL